MTARVRAMLFWDRVRRRIEGIRWTPWRVFVHARWTVVMLAGGLGLLFRWDGDAWARPAWFVVAALEGATVFIGARALSRRKDRP